jgi:hypothetical protein
LSSVRSYSFFIALIGIALLVSCGSQKSLTRSEKTSWNKARRDWKDDGKRVHVTEGSSAAASASKGGKSDTPGRAAYKTPVKDDYHDNTPPVKIKRKSDAMVAGILTEDMWDELFPNRCGIAQVGPNSASEWGKGDFYTFDAFVAATKHFPDFLNEGNPEIRRRELAAFLAHMAHETGGLRYLEQITVTRSYSVNSKDYPSVEGKDYRGRGPIQLSYNYNYGQFSKAYFGDKQVLLNCPELLAENAEISFASAIWFWMTPQPPKPSCHDVIVGNWDAVNVDKEYKRFPGFGLTLNIINAPQCGQPTQPHTQKRYDYYDKFCKYFNTTKGDYCDCEEQVPYGRRPVAMR